MTARIVGDLDMRDPVLVRAEGREEFAGHALLVVEVVLKKHVVGADLVDDGHGLLYAVQVKAWDVLGIHGLDQKANASFAETPRRKAQIVDDGLPHAICIGSLRGEADQTVELPAAECPRIVDRETNPVLELANAVRQAGDPPLTPVPVPGW